MTNLRGNLRPDQRSSEMPVDFRFLAILSIILVNTAAAGSVLTFWATVWGAPIAMELAASAAGTFKFFGFGVLAALAAAGAGQVAEMFYERADKLGRDSPMRGVWAGLGIYSHFMAIFAAALGILSFAWGAFQGIVVLEASNGGVSKKSALNFLMSVFG